MQHRVENPRQFHQRNTLSAQPYNEDDTMLFISWMDQVSKREVVSVGWLVFEDDEQVTMSHGVSSTSYHGQQSIPRKYIISCEEVEVT